jgi:hypothetical protein
MTQPIQRYELMELTVPAGAGTRVNFQDNPQLRTMIDQEIYVKDIELFLTNSYANSQVNPALPGLTLAEAIKAVLCLYVQGEERIHFIPLLKLNHITDAAVPFQEQANQFADLAKVDWTKSYIQFSVAPAGTPYVMPFCVNYIKIQKQV